MNRFIAAAVLAAASVGSCLADDGSEAWSVHGQATYIAQHKASFPAPYSGANSLSPETATSYSFSTTLFVGRRLWQGAEAYGNLEGVQGVPFSNLTGLGGFTNGELQKTAGPQLIWYRARLFLRQTFGFGGGTETLEADKNRLASNVDQRRLVLTVGNLAITDLFDDNRFAHDPRTDFMNWSLIDSGAYDFAADARGYTWGVAAEWHDLDWALRAGRFLEPGQSNGMALDTRISRHYGDQLELEKDVNVAGKDGKIRVLAFHNVGVMGRYRDALAVGHALGQPPDLALVRRRNAKWGAALNVEQELGGDIGAFGRVSWNNGQTETYSFTEIDRSIALGAAFGGTRWGRKNDELGLALVRNGLSAAHRDYLAAGGLGFFLGDGRLNYRPEQIGELYYNLGFGKAVKLGVDAQRVANPGYNADRGPVNFYGVRAHAEF